jgi:hypothetical protein
VRQCEWQFVAVRTAVCSQCARQCAAVHLVVYVWQCARQCAAVRHCAAVCNSVWQRVR